MRASRFFTRRSTGAVEGPTNSASRGAADEVASSAARRPPRARGWGARISVLLELPAPRAPGRGVILAPEAPEERALLERRGGPRLELGPARRPEQRILCR